MKIVFVLFEGITALDIVGPYEVLARLPGAQSVFAAKSAGAVKTDDGLLSLVATRAFSEITEADLVVVPGGWGTRPLMQDPATLDWLRAIDRSTTLTTSVCTGALLLGAAGLLKGKRATTHWSQRALLAELGAVVTDERVVTDGKIVTAAGVSAGIDMALAVAARLAGETVAKAIQLGIEYDPQPPFDAGSPAKAGPELTELMQSMMAAGLR